MKKMEKKNNIFKQENRLVGGLVPRPLADKLSLYSLYSEQTRSKIIATLLKKQLSIYPEENMIDEIGKRLSKKVKGLVISKKVAFLRKAREIMLKKKINSRHIEQIIRIARHSHAENED